MKLGWDPPEVLSGSLKGYKVLVDGELSVPINALESTDDMCCGYLDVQLLCKPAKSKSCIVPGLECGTTHQFEVQIGTMYCTCECTPKD